MILARPGLRGVLMANRKTVKSFRNDVCRELLLAAGYDDKILRNTLASKEKSARLITAIIRFANRGRRLSSAEFDAFNLAMDEKSADWDTVTSHYEEDRYAEVQADSVKRAAQRALKDLLELFSQPDIRDEFRALLDDWICS